MIHLVQVIFVRFLYSYIDVLLKDNIVVLLMDCNVVWLNVDIIVWWHVDFVDFLGDGNVDVVWLYGDVIARWNRDVVVLRYSNIVALLDDVVWLDRNVVSGFNF